MQVRFKCGSCSTSVQVDSSHAGKKAKCPKCGTVLQIPSLEKIAAAQAAKSGVPVNKVAAATAAAMKPKPQPAKQEVNGLSDFAPRFDDEDFEVEAPAPLPESASPAAALPSYYRQPEPETVTYAGFWKRLGASFIDGILFNIAFSIFEFAVNAVVSDVELILLLLNLVANWLYFAFMESSYYQATFGKQALGIKVTDLNGRPIGFGRASARYFGKLLSILSLGIGYIMIAFTPKKQALHDMIAGCLVVNR